MQVLITPRSARVQLHMQVLITPRSARVQLHMQVLITFRTLPIQIATIEMANPANSSIAYRCVSTFPEPTDIYPKPHT